MKLRKAGSELRLRHLAPNPEMMNTWLMRVLILVDR